MDFNDHFSQGFSTGVVIQDIEVTISASSNCVLKQKLPKWVILPKHVYDPLKFPKTISMVRISCKMHAKILLPRVMLICSFLRFLKHVFNMKKYSTWQCYHGNWYDSYCWCDFAHLGTSLATPLKCWSSWQRLHRDQVCSVGMVLMYLFYGAYFTFLFGSFGMASAVPIQILWFNSPQHLTLDSCCCVFFPAGMIYILRSCETSIKTSLPPYKNILSCLFVYHSQTVAT